MKRLGALSFLWFWMTVVFAPFSLFGRSSFSGIVTEDGKVVSGATVTLEEQTTSTNQNGRFVFEDIPPGSYHMNFIHPNSGKRETATVVVTSEGSESFRFDFKEAESRPRAVIRLPEVVVRGRPEPKTPGKQSLFTEEIRRVPGTTGDPLKALTSLPGVAAINDLSGMLFIRGGGPEDNFFYFDRMILGYPYHFGGITSTLSAELVGQIDVHAGGFGAQFGNAQAIIDIHSRDDRRRDTSMTANVNALLSESYFQTPLGDKATLRLAGRRTYADLIVPKIVTLEQVTAFPRFWDYQERLDYDLSPTQRLRFNAFASDDLMRFLLKAEDVTDNPEFAGELHFANGFDGQGVTLESEFGEQATLDSTFSRLGTKIDFGFGQGYYLRILPVSWSWREDLRLTLNSRHALEAGSEFITTPYHVQAHFFRPPSDEDADQVFDPDEMPVVDSDTHERPNLLGVYLQDRMTLTKTLTMTTGGRLGIISATGETRFDPRLSLSWKAPMGTTLRASGGFYSQAPQPVQIDPQWGNPDLKAFHATHYVVEAEKEVSRETFLKVAAYYKDLDNLITEDVEKVYLNQGKGYSRGLETLLRFSPSERVLGWVSYTYSQAKRKYRPEDPLVLYAYDQTHVATTMLSWQPNLKWELGAKWQYATGVPFTPILRGEPVYNPDGSLKKYMPIYGAFNSERQPPFHRLDVRAARTFRFSGWQMQAYLEILNAYYRKNVLDVSYNDDYSKREYVYQLPIVPFIGVTARF